jgi:hypothetical protein
MGGTALHWGQWLHALRTVAPLAMMAMAAVPRSTRMGTVAFAVDA